MHNRNEAIYQNFLEDMVADMKEASLSHTKQVFRTIKSCWIRVSALEKRMSRTGSPQSCRCLAGTRTPDSSRHFQKICHRQHPGSAGRSARRRNTCHHRDRHAPRMLLCPGTRYQRKPPDHSDDESDPVLLGGNLWIK